jgi:hypothetical protein
MTTAQLDHLRKIDAHLAHLLEIAAKRTPGRWQQEDIITNEVWSDADFICDCMDNSDANAAYIAACAGKAEAGWESTRILIAELLSLHERMEKIGCPEFVCEPIQKLLARWPLESLLQTAKV